MFLNFSNESPKGPCTVVIVECRKFFFLAFEVTMHTLFMYYTIFFNFSPLWLVSFLALEMEIRYLNVHRDFEF